MIVQIPLSKWYAKDNVTLLNDGRFLETYHPLLGDHREWRCCLGHCARAHGVSSNTLYGCTAPSHVTCALPKSDWMLSEQNDSELSRLAMLLNDASMEFKTEDLPTRMGNLITVFAEGGDDLQFINDDPV